MHIVCLDSYELLSVEVIACAHGRVIKIMIKLRHTRR